MNRAIALLIPFAFAACGDPQAGDTCKENADCEGGTATMICDMGTDTAATEGTCAETTEPMDTDTTPV